MTWTDRLAREPARVVAVILAVIGVVSAFGLGITDVQSDGIVALVAAVLALLGGEATRANVTPVGRHRNQRGAITATEALLIVLTLAVIVLLVAFLV